jgi:hypothetical protein
MKTPIVAILTLGLAAPTPAQDLVRPAAAELGAESASLGSAPSDALDLPAGLDGAGTAPTCPFASGDPMRLIRLLGIGGNDAIRAEAPHRAAQARLCAS